jgi:hypothetical protein
MAKHLRFPALALLAALAATGAGSEDLSRNAPSPEEPLRRPEDLEGAARRGDGRIPMRIERIGDVFAAVKACWRTPPGSGFSGEEITVRLAFKRSGEVLGQPRITYYRAGTDSPARAAFAQSVRDALARCTPLPFSPAFGAAVAGRPFTFRFLDARAL